uniref:Uncharacterized protein n=1 Tax=Arundo donax TaxID=35708 RepID=A0A0A9FEL3_ARUDO
MLTCSPGCFAPDNELPIRRTCYCMKHLQWHMMSDDWQNATDWLKASDE